MSKNVKKIQYNRYAISLLLEIAKNEYENEHNRTSVIDTKTSIALPIISAYFLALAQMNDYKFIFEAKVASFADSIIPPLLFVFYTSSLVLALIATVNMVRVVTTRTYNTIKPSDLYDDDFLTFDSRVISIELIKLYINATETNKNENDARIPLYKRGWLLTTISIILFVFYIIIKNYIS